MKQNKIQQYRDKIDLLEKNALDAVVKANKNLSKIQNMKQQLQSKCSHPETAVVRLGQEPGSGKSLFQCQDCDFVGYTTDFRR